MNKTELLLFLLQYEIRSSRIVPWIGDPFLQNLLAKYYARKVSQKLERMEKSLGIHDELIEKYGSILAAAEKNK